MAELVIKLVNGELAGKTMQSLTKEVNAAATAFKKAEVGTQEWVNAQKKFEDVKKLQGDLKKQIDSTTAASDALKAAWNRLPGSQFFNQIGDSFKMAKQGVGGLITSMGALKTAIAATGIGLLVVAVMALFQWFTKTEEGGDLLAKAMNVVDAVFRQITESIRRLMSGDLIGFFKGITTEMAGTVSEAAKLADAMDALEEKESAFQVVQKAGLRDKAEYLKMTKDETLAIENRIAAVDKAMKISGDLNKRELENQREHLRILSGGSAEITDAMIKTLEASGLTMQNAKDFFRKGNITQADLDEANQALAKFLEIQESAFNDERELLTVRNKLTKKERTEDHADQQAAAKREQDSLKQHLAAQENLRKLANEKRLAEMEDGRLKERERVNLEYEDRIVNLQGNEMEIIEQMKILRELQHSELDAIDKKWEKKKEEEDKAKRDKEYNEKLQAIDLELVDELNWLNEKFIAKKVTEDDYALQSQAAAIEAQQKKLAVTKERFGVESAEYKKQYSQLLELQKSAAKSSAVIAEKLTEDNAAALLGSLNVFGNLFGSLAAMYAQGTAEWKAFATAQAIISTIQGAINAYTSTSAIPVVGPALAPIAAAIAAAAGYQQVQRINSVQIPTPKPRKGEKAEKGFVLRGPSHAQGGIPIEAEGDEIILTKGVYRNPKLRAIASSINLAAGGRSFALGGPPINPFTTPTRPGASSEIPNIDNTPVIQRLDKLIEAMDSRIDRIQVVNNLQDTEKGLRTLNTLREEADL